MTSLTLRVTHFTDLCHNPHIISEKRDDTKKVMSKVTFPHWFVLLRSQKKSPQEREKKETCPFVSCHWFSQCEKAQPCKISVEVGGGPQPQCAFFTAANLKEIHCPRCVPNTHSGVCPLFMVQTEAGKGMWRWSRRHEMSHKNTMKEWND